MSSEKRIYAHVSDEEGQYIGGKDLTRDEMDCLTRLGYGVTPIRPRWWDSMKSNGHVHLER